MTVTEYSAGGVVVNDGHVLVVFESRTQAWALPKGHIEGSETPEAAAKREVFEESGLAEIEMIRFLGCYERPTKRDRTVTKSISMFLFTTRQKVVAPISDDVGACRWVAIDDVCDTLTYAEDSTFFAAHQASILQESVR